MSPSRKCHFDSPALYRALNARRQLQGLSWNEVSKQMGVAASTIRRTERGGPMETDGILAMIRWVEGVPEDFIQGAKVAPFRAAAQSRQIQLQGFVRSPR